jgi:hypothetical protein
VTDETGDTRDFHGSVPTSHNPNLIAEQVGDPEADDIMSGGHEGAAAGAIAGTAVAGPVGLVAGAAIGAVAGVAGEEADPVDDPSARARRGDIADDTEADGG